MVVWILLGADNTIGWICVSIWKKPLYGIPIEVTTCTTNLVGFHRAKNAQGARRKGCTVRRIIIIFRANEMTFVIAHANSHATIYRAGSPAPLVRVRADNT
jgi:hypothetical protein